MSYDSTLDFYRFGSYNLTSAQGADVVFQCELCAKERRMFSFPIDYKYNHVCQSCVKKAIKSTSSNNPLIARIKSAFNKMERPELLVEPHLHDIAYNYAQLVIFCSQQPQGVLKAEADRILNSGSLDVIKSAMLERSLENVILQNDKKFARFIPKTNVKDSLAEVEAVDSYTKEQMQDTVLFVMLQRVLKMFEMYQLSIKQVSNVPMVCKHCGSVVCGGRIKVGGSGRMTCDNKNCKTYKECLELQFNLAKGGVVDYVKSEAVYKYNNAGAIFEKKKQEQKERLKKALEDKKQERSLTSFRFWTDNLLESDNKSQCDSCKKDSARLVKFPDKTSHCVPCIRKACTTGKSRLISSDKLQAFNLVNFSHIDQKHFTYAKKLAIFVIACAQWGTGSVQTRAKHILRQTFSHNLVPDSYNGNLILLAKEDSKNRVLNKFMPKKSLDEQLDDVEATSYASKGDMQNIVLTAILRQLKAFLTDQASPTAREYTLATCKRCGKHTRAEQAYIVKETRCPSASCKDLPKIIINPDGDARYDTQ